MRGEGTRERERNINVQEKHGLVTSPTPPTGDLACNPGMCHDWGLNWRPFGSWAMLSPLSHTSQDMNHLILIPHTLIYAKEHKEITPCSVIFVQLSSNFPTLFHICKLLTKASGNSFYQHLNPIMWQTEEQC